MRKHMWQRWMFAFVAIILVLGLSAPALLNPVHAGAQELAAAADGGQVSPDKIVSPDGITMDDPKFVSYFNSHGGLAIFGWPIGPKKEETLEDGKSYPVEYTERARFEYHQENQAPNDVLLGQFGRQVFKINHPDLTLKNDTKPEVRSDKVIGPGGSFANGGFFDYWSHNGAQAIFGYPLYDLMKETIGGQSYDVQYFERARFEYHPENQPPYHILLGQFGRQIMALGSAPTGGQPSGGGNPNPSTFTYTPGGPNYAWPGPGSVEQRGDGWTRIRQAANGQYLPWTFLVRIRADRPLDQVAQWDSATKLLLAAQDQPINIQVEIRRDPDAAKECSCDPYQQAGGDASNGLGWFVAGNGASVTVNGSGQTSLTGLGVRQVSFPKNWGGTYTFVFTIQPHGQVVMNQGVRVTSTDNWPLP